MMKGILEFLVFGHHKNDLLKKFVFKIVPMLNVEGVINGWYIFFPHELNLIDSRFSDLMVNPNAL